MMPIFPGWPGPAYVGRINMGIAPVAPPAFPGHPGPTAQQPSPLDGLAAYGVPVTQLPSGQSVIMAAGGNQGFQMPPSIPGFPRFPEPPADFLTGGPAGGILQGPVAPVEPFDQGNQVRQYQQSE